MQEVLSLFQVNSNQIHFKTPIIRDRLLHLFHNKYEHFSYLFEANEFISEKEVRGNIFGYMYKYPLARNTQQVLRRVLDNNQELFLELGCDIIQPTINQVHLSSLIDVSLPTYYLINKESFTVLCLIYLDKNNIKDISKVFNS